MSAVAPVLRNEVGKLRHLRVGLVVSALAVGVVALTLFTMATSGDDTVTWALPLAGLSFAFPLVSPLLIAVVASRVVDIEHQGQGWQLAQGLGQSRGRLCRAKLVVAGALLTAATVAASLVVLVLTAGLGASGPPALGTWAGATLGAVIVGLSLLALHLLLSAVVDNQLVGLGIGILGTVLAVFSSGLPSWFAHLTPWGYYSLSAGADYVDGDLRLLTPSAPSLAALAALTTVVVVLATTRLDRSEV